MVHHFHAYVRLLPLALIGGFFIFWPAAFFLLALYEKKPVRWYEPLTGGHPPESSTHLSYAPVGVPDLSPYVSVMFDQIRAAGFSGGELCRHAKGGTYRTLAAFWLSPQRETLVIVVGGSMARVRFRKTLLQSRVGRTVVTTSDEWGAVDLSGTDDGLVVKNAGFLELWGVHQSRLAALHAAPAQFEPNGLSAQYASINAARVQRMEAMGIARFINPDRSVWVCTLKGAFLSMVSNTMNVFTPKPDAYRNRLPRPGDLNYMPPGFTPNQPL